MVDMVEYWNQRQMGEIEKKNSTIWKKGWNSLEEILEKIERLG